MIKIAFFDVDGTLLKLGIGVAYDILASLHIINQVKCIIIKLRIVLFKKKIKIGLIFHVL